MGSLGFVVKGAGVEDEDRRNSEYANPVQSVAALECVFFLVALQSPDDPIGYALMIYPFRQKLPRRWESLALVKWTDLSLHNAQTFFLQLFQECIHPLKSGLGNFLRTWNGEAPANTITT